MFEELKKRLKEEEEGIVPCMYLDSLGYVTVGVGHLLPSSATAAELPFVNEGGLPASAEQIREEYARVRELAPNQLPRYYLGRTKLRLPASAIDTLLNEDVATMHRGVSALIPEFGDMPAAAQDALVDMAFQLGPHGLVTKFPKLVAGARGGEFAVCAAECHSAGIPDSRNRIRAELFRQAATA